MQRLPKLLHPGSWDRADAAPIKRKVIFHDEVGVPPAPESPSARYVSALLTLLQEQQTPAERTADVLTTQVQW